MAESHAGLGAQRHERRRHRLHDEPGDDRVSAVGELELEFEALHLADYTGRRILTYAAASGTASEATRSAAGRAPRLIPRVAVVPERRSVVTRAAPYAAANATRSPRCTPWLAETENRMGPIRVVAATPSPSKVAAPHTRMITRRGASNRPLLSRSTLSR